MPSLSARAGVDNVQVSQSNWFKDGATWMVTFLGPYGDVPLLGVNGR